MYKLKKFIIKYARARPLGSCATPEPVKKHGGDYDVTTNDNEMTQRS